VNQREFWAGLFVLCGLIFLASAYAYLLWDDTNRDVNIYVVEARNVSGVNEGTPVMMGGYGIGAVQNIEVFTKPELHFSFELSIRKDIPIPKGSKAVLATRLAGGGVIDIRAPEDPGPPMSTDEHLVLEPPTDVQNLIETAGIMMEDLATITGKGREFVEDPQLLEKRLKVVDALLLETEGILVDTHSLINNLERTLSEAEPGIDRSLEFTEKTLENTNTLIGDLHGTVALMEKSLTDLSEVFAVMEAYDPDANPEIRETLKSLTVSSQSLEKLMNAMEDSPIRTMRKGTEEESSAAE
jgi:phospholipid/cholesterol/gamma-HCH transport system substrate-binding protein